MVCVTGGYTAAPQIEDALSSGACDMVGLARPFCVAPSDLSARLAADGVGDIPSIQTILWYYHQFQRVGDGLGIDWEVGVEEAEERQKAYHQRWAVEYKAKL